MKLLPLLFLLALPAVAQAQLLFTTNSGAITITGYTGSPTVVNIPSAINGYPVTSIGDYAFYECYSLTSVTIPNSVTSIGDYAFYYCTSLTSVTIGSGVTNIGSSAFSGCSSLTSVTIDSGVTSIGSYAFASCSGLTSVTIPNSVTSIGVGAFQYCSSLTAINVAATNSAFSSLNGVLFNKNQTTLVEYPGGLAGSYTIPNSVISIGDSAFDSCSSLTSVTIPNSVTSIGDYAFLGCSGLTSVTIGNSVTSIGSYAFYDCISLTSVTIGNSVTSIGDDAFDSCTNLTSVTIPNSVTNIGSSAFSYCTKLTGVHFQGNAPGAGSDSSVFYSAPATIYYLPGTTGWSSTFDGRPTQLWAPSPTITTASPLPAGVAGTAYSTNLAAIGSTSPYIWSLAAGNLPAGLSLSTNGVISGTPNSATNLATIASFTVQVVGGNGLSTNKVFGLTIITDTNSDAMVHGVITSISLTYNDNEYGKYYLTIVKTMADPLRFYILERSTNMSSWEELNMGILPGASGSLDFYGFWNPTNFPNRGFFRLKSQ